MQKKLCYINAYALRVLYDVQVTHPTEETSINNYIKVYYHIMI